MENKYKLKWLYKFANRLETGLNANPNVVCIGLYNHGKSSLLNALTQNYDNALFKVADKRETTENKSYEFNGIVYTDTPGLNAVIQDDELAFEAVISSDVNIFVHSQNDGELSKKEVEYLQNLVSKYCTAQMLIGKTVFVMNHIESLNDEEIKKAKQRFVQQIKEVFGLDPILLTAKTVSYIKAMRENKAVLAKQSGVEEIKEQVLKLCKDEVVKYRRKKRLSLVYSEIINLLQQKIEETAKAIDDEKARSQKIWSEINQMIQNINSIKSKN
ncbi:GTPase [uncultured Campylobacter sp.]|uniref:GTPase n=1 Tax=uncultured Campylobacter sp. TaxID=218934 RepID=UPI003448F833